MSDQTEDVSRRDLLRKIGAITLTTFGVHVVTAEAAQHVHNAVSDVKKTGDYKPLAARSVQNMLAFNAEAAGLGRRVHPHLFRHSYATWALRKGMNPLQLQRILGHADLTMIANVYSHLNASDSYAAMLAVLQDD